MTDIAAEKSHVLMRTAWGQGKTVVTLQGAVDVSTANDLTQALSRVVDLSESKLCIDLTAATLIDSAGLGALVLAQKQARRLGTDVLLVGVDGEVGRVLRITGLDRTFRLAASFTGPGQALTDAGATPS